ncbi:AraC family transcriptional regulator [Pseudomonas schmalbachii]|uniref:Helix-turn-helix domain-containing protein n=1 Tax=Pseudomonas schmalbachii TaxID=2816993 RepID=A0ABS3TU87_9PSED|nr:AraC family transcriptional regulator [Pseudomonas schmalbachii]MBO3277203.1 helix-turn-helix domain-containing protein [Pseudomonas schmalbachii]
MSPILSLRRYNHEHLAHSHEHAQLVLGLSGRLDFEIGGRGSLVTCQTLAVVPRETHHACASPQGSHCLVLDLEDEDDLLQTLGLHADAGRRLLERPGPVRLSPNQEQLVGWLAGSPLQDPVIARQGAILLLASLAADCERTAEAAQLPLASLDSYIDRHSGHPLQVADLARLTGLSSARFHARFLAETGQTPMDYVRSRRLHHALEMLRGTHLPVGEIAARVGYASQSAFTAALVREFGATPREVRREARDNSR